MGQLSSYIKSLREEFTNHYIGSPAHHSQHQLQQGYQDQETPPTGKNLPEVVNNIVWARQLEAKVHVIQTVCVCALFAHIKLKAVPLYI